MDTDNFESLVVTGHTYVEPPTSLRLLPDRAMIIETPFTLILRGRVLSEPANDTGDIHDFEWAQARFDARVEVSGDLIMAGGSVTIQGVRHETAESVAAALGKAGVGWY